MKKSIYLILIISQFFYCGQKQDKQDKVERHKEDGVEVVINHIEPYKISGEPSTLILEEEFTIDTEKDEIAETGLVEIENFDVDSKGNIYCLRLKSKENHIFKFDNKGNFAASFGRRGQGPGELIYPRMFINNLDELIIRNLMQPKILILSTDGNLINEIRLPMELSVLKQLENENYFIYTLSRSGPQDVQLVWSVYSPEFEKIKDVERQELHGDSGKFSYEMHKPYATRENIYIGKRSPSYEIWVYSSEGNLKRKIKKDYEPVKISDEYKKERISQSEEMKKKGLPPPPGYSYLPEYWPAFHELFASDTERLFVMTYEKSKNPREFVYDIFNPDGVFIGKTSLGNYRGMYSPFPVKVKNERLYSLREKESGYNELVVYKMRWE
jgi:hypothetical protein